MNVHIEQIHSEVTVYDADLPLSPEQIERLVKIVLQRLDQQQRERQANRSATAMRSSVIPPRPGQED